MPGNRDIEIMIIETDGYFSRMHLRSEKDISEKEIREFYDQLRIEGISWAEIPDKLCERFDLRKEEIHEGIRVDFVIDTDTELIYKPRY